MKLFQTCGARMAGLGAAVVLLGACTAVQAQPYINVTVGGAFAPGVYGQIAIGNNPVPPLWNVTPMLVGPVVYHQGPPLYLHVPQHERSDWERYCRSYQACGRPVHFVQVDERQPWWQHYRPYRPPTVVQPAVVMPPPGWRNDHDGRPGRADPPAWGRDKDRDHDQRHWRDDHPRHAPERGAMPRQERDQNQWHRDGNRGDTPRDRGARDGSGPRTDHHDRSGDRPRGRD